jgi:hypothetical protein
VATEHWINCYDKRSRSLVNKGMKEGRSLGAPYGSAKRQGYGPLPGSVFKKDSRRSPTYTQYLGLGAVKHLHQPPRPRSLHALKLLLKPKGATPQPLPLLYQPLLLP